NRLGKNLWTSAGEGDPIRIYTGHTDIDEAKFIVDEIKMLHREGVSLNHIAILYRSNAQSRILEHNIFSSNLPYRVYGGLRFFERAEIKHAIAYLRLIANKNDDSAFLRIVNFPTRGIGSRSLESLQDTSRRDGCSLWDAAVKSSDQTPSIKKGLPYFVHLIKHIESGFEGLTLPQMIDLIINESGLKDHYTNEKDGLDRVSNLNELVSAAATFLNNDNNESTNPLGDFLNYSSLESGDMQASEGSDAIQLMTIHSSKGLEFDVVFISGLEEGLCPHEQSLFESKGLEEERRLMYVAVTRARSKLYLSYALSRMLHGQTRYGMPSRFLEEIPENLVKNINTINFKNNVDQIEENYSQPSQQKHSWRIGESVMHEKFGQGTVLGYEGNADDLRIQIKFSKAGTKWLAMEYAKLFKH
ncbi:MAG: helicase, partial [Pseudomonadota bacterium]